MLVTILRVVRGSWKIAHVDPFSGQPKTPKQFPTLGLNGKEIDTLFGKYLLIP